MKIQLLENIISKGTTSSKVNDMVAILLSAINDWPEPIDDLNAYHVHVNQFIGGEVTKGNIAKAIENVNYNSNAWHSESLTQLLDIFDYYDDGVSLKMIIDDIQLKLNHD